MIDIFLYNMMKMWYTDSDIQERKDIPKPDVKI